MVRMNTTCGPGRCGHPLGGRAVRTRIGLWRDTSFGPDSRDCGDLGRHAAMRVPAHTGIRSTTAVVGHSLVISTRSSSGSSNEHTTHRPPAVMHYKIRSEKLHFLYTNKTRQSITTANGKLLDLDL